MRKYLLISMICGLSLASCGSETLSPSEQLYDELGKSEPDWSHVQALIKGGADPYERIDSRNSYPIRLALRNLPTSEFSELVCSGGGPNTKMASFDPRNQIYERYPTIIFDAIFVGDIKKIDAIAECGANLLQENGRGQTPLEVSAGVDPEIFRRLLYLSRNSEIKPSTIRRICKRLSLIKSPTDGESSQPYLSALNEFGYEC